MNQSGILDLIPADIRNQWIKIGAYPNKPLYQLFCEKVQIHPDRPAVVSLEQTISYEQLQYRVACLAASFRSLGVAAGDVIAYQLSNSWHHCAIDLAAAALGAIVAPLPSNCGRLELQSLLIQCGARVIIVESRFMQTDVCAMIESLRSDLLSLQILVVSGDARAGWHTLESLYQSKPIASNHLPNIDPGTPVRFLISSRTGSDPKWVACSHNALAGGRGRFLKRIHPDGSIFRGLFLMSLATAFGSSATYGVLSSLGGAVLVLSQFDASTVIRAIGSLQPTHVFAVPALLRRIAADPDLAQTDTPNLIAIISNGSKIDETSVRRCTEAFRCGFITLYDSADGVNCHTMLDDNFGTILHKTGRPNPDVCAIRIVDDQKREVAQGHVGEITARGPITPMQYVNNPELDARYRDEDGWVYTGDLGFIDEDGYLILTGRKKEIIIRGGVNIIPVQIESIAVSHPAVVSAVCIPVADQDLGQRICLCLVMRDGAERPSLAQFTRFLLDQGLEKNKLPEYLRYLRQLPLGPAGKVDKRRLTAELESAQFLPGPDVLNQAVSSIQRAH